MARARVKINKEKKVPLSDFLKDEYEGLTKEDKLAIKFLRKKSYKFAPLPVVD